MELFEDGGLKDQGNTIDPMSGNSVPVGSTKKEVRDDIPAMLSEGEFDLPADVVRYVGLDKLMKLRQDAKMGLQKMNQMGQMGNSEEAVIPDNLPYNMISPMANQPLNTVKPQMKQGGVLQAQNGTFIPLSEQTPSERQPDMIRKGGGTGLEGMEIVIYYNPETKDKINVIVFNGVPQRKIPEGYILYDDYLKTLDENDLVNEVIDVDKPEIVDPQPDVTTSKSSKGNIVVPPEPVDYSSMSLDELKNLYDKNKKTRLALTGMGVLNPMIAVFGRLATTAQEKNIIQAMKKFGYSPPEPDSNFFSSISESVGDFVSNVFGTDKEKVVNNINADIKPKLRPNIGAQTESAFSDDIVLESGPAITSTSDPAGFPDMEQIDLSGMGAGAGTTARPSVQTTTVGSTMHQDRTQEDIAKEAAEDARRAEEQRVQEEARKKEEADRDKRKKYQKEQREKQRQKQNEDFTKKKLKEFKETGKVTGFKEGGLASRK